MAEPLPAPDVAEVARRLVAAGIDVEEHQAGDALAVSREAATSRSYRAITGGLEPMIAFDPRWRR